MLYLRAVKHVGLQLGSDYCMDARMESRLATTALPRDELRTAIVTWIERSYHRRRRQSVLARLTPIEFEGIMTAPASQAA